MGKREERKGKERMGCRDDPVPHNLAMELNSEIVFMLVSDSVAIILAGQHQLGHCFSGTWACRVG
jgi:hypothetical protein